MLTGRSHPGHVQPQSRTLSALRCGPEIVRLARPTSMTIDSEPRMMRVTAQSHASLSTALAESGSECSMFAPGAPGSPSRVSSEAVTWRVRPLRYEAVVESAHAYVDQGVTHALLARTVIVLASPLGQRFQCRAHGSAPDLVEVAIDVDRTFVAVGDVEAPRLDSLGFFGGAALGVGSMARVVAVLTKASNCVFAGMAQQLDLVEALAGSGCGAGNEGEVGEADLTRHHCRRTPPQTVQLLADAEAIAGSSAAQMTVGLDSGDGAVEALPVVLVGLGELCGEDRELELVLIDLLTPADQLSGDLLADPGCNSPHPTLHTEIVRTDVWRVKKKGGVNFA